MTTRSSARLDSLSPSDHRRVAQYVREVAGIQLPETKRALIESRLRKRQHALGCSSLRDYIQLALEDDRSGAEKVLLIDQLTTNKTDFFRESTHFDYLTEHLRRCWPGWSSSRRRQPLRFWSAGCSSGEEPYTLAMVLNHLSDELNGLDYRIFATDVSTEILRRAKAGVYSQSQIVGIPLAMRQRFLLRHRQPSKPLYRVDASVRERVVFRQFNLMASSYAFEAPFDFIFCRNVMIYFDHETREKMLSRFHQTLVPDGIFFIGHSEGLAGNRRDFETLIPTVYRKREIVHG